MGILKVLTFDSSLIIVYRLLLQFLIRMLCAIVLYLITKKMQKKSEIKIYIFEKRCLEWNSTFFFYLFCALDWHAFATLNRAIDWDWFLWGCELVCDHCCRYTLLSSMSRCSKSLWEKKVKYLRDGKIIVWSEVWIKYILRTK